MKSNTGMKVYTAADFPETPPCNLGQRVAYYINRLDSLSAKEQNAWNYLVRLHGEDKLWDAHTKYEEQVKNERDRKQQQRDQINPDR